jgi:tRNA pseudouridine55 synthase
MGAGPRVSRSDSPMVKRKTRGLYHGYLVVDKPAGWTSHEVVGKVRRILGERRVGHAGTLDPAAVGVLPIAVGLATRTAEYLSGASKGYVADVTFGVTTDSADIDGVVTSVRDPGHLEESDIVLALESFKGDQLQVPPAYSAIRVNGERLYERARRGESVELEPRPITVHDILLDAWEPPTARIWVDCSKGTYIRSLARDIGERVGTGAYMSNLVRVRTGPFSLSDAVTIPELEALIAGKQWEMIAFHPDTVLQDWPAVVLDAHDGTDWRHGKPVALEGAAGDLRLYDGTGHWLGVGQGTASGDHILPTKVVTDVMKE